MFNWLKHIGQRHRANPAKSTGGPVLDEYVDSFPSAQNAVDLIPGWNHRLPDFAGVEAGAGYFYADPRILWALEQYGSIAGKRILELGPLEASHTYMMHQREPAAITAIEANKLAFLRCLIVKETLNLTRARFLLGDCLKWLQAEGERYDLIVASGILYHMSNPVGLLTSMAARADAVFIWTHYFDAQECPQGDTRALAFTGEVKVERVGGIDVRLHGRGYHNAWIDKRFCGGMHDIHYWLEKAQIVEVLKASGLDDVSFDAHQPDHPNGPAISIFARRSAPATA